MSLFNTSCTEVFLSLSFTAGCSYWLVSQRTQSNLHFCCSTPHTVQDDHSYCSHNFTLWMTVMPAAIWCSICSNSVSLLLCEYSRTLCLCPVSLQLTVYIYSTCLSFLPSGIRSKSSSESSSSSSVQPLIWPQSGASLPSVVTPSGWMIWSLGKRQEGTVASN